MCDICNGETCVDGNCKAAGDPDCASECPNGQCGTPCSCLGGTSGMNTTVNSCWGVAQSDGTYMCFKDYGNRSPTRINDPVCCGNRL